MCKINTPIKSYWEFFNMCVPTMEFQSTRKKIWKGEVYLIGYTNK